MSLMLKHKLLNLSVIRHVSIVVDPTGLIPCSTSYPAPSRNQEQFKPIFGALIVHIPLNQFDKPVRCYPLRLKVLAHVEIPHEANVHCALVTDESMRTSLAIVHMQPHSPLLSGQSQLKIVAVVEAMPHILLNLFLYRIDRLNCICRQVSIKWNQFNFIQLEYD